MRSGGLRRFHGAVLRSRHDECATTKVRNHRPSQLHGRTTNRRRNTRSRQNGWDTPQHGRKARWETPWSKAGTTNSAQTANQTKCQQQRIFLLVAVWASPRGRFSARNRPSTLCDMVAPFLTHCNFTPAASFKSQRTLSTHLPAFVLWGPGDQRIRQGLFKAFCAICLSRVWPVASSSAAQKQPQHPPAFWCCGVVEQQTRMEPGATRSQSTA